MEHGTLKTEPKTRNQSTNIKIINPKPKTRNTELINQLTNQPIN
jgi:hypothetical protein